ncbi:16S rRNA (uracil(1498)-N(3))-methyltransferase [Synechococcus sp. PCC 7336]|uniref:16S rRNA (uracil(1498)-N(3))-methyltransferase n=1 Tax=Synechococcus sp. PCC 7336 TaxID=195250 RepID=UPI0003475BF5|nr:16S rRNA (uracil(1498)-N(3))-methyltransferase [Synechococcus sp. PCC 7336]
MVLPECPQTLKSCPRLAFERGTLAARWSAGDRQFPLEKSQRHYLERVRRLKVGDDFLAFDSTGLLWRAALVEGGAQLVEALQPLQRELPVSLELAIAVPKGSGLDETVRQLTELGASRLVPLLTERTLVQPSAKKVERWRAIAREATEQCERVFVPEVLEPLAWEQWLRYRGGEVRWMAAAREDALGLLDRLQRDRSRLSGGIAVAIGPEGGWTDEELEAGRDRGVEAVNLGPRILRAVTAPLVVASVVAAELETFDLRG